MKSTAALKKILIIDAFFILLIFCVPIILKEFFSIGFKNFNTSFIVILSIWSIIKLAVTSLNIRKITGIDITIAGLFIYVLCHFYFFSETTIYYYKLWIYIGYVYVFYMFKWALSINYKSKFLIHFTLLTILAICITQSGIGFLQYFKVIEVQSNYFDVLGTFSSPNFFGVFLSFGLIILIWYFFVRKVDVKFLKILIILGFIIFGSLIILSKSRATWIAIFGSILVLFVTSSYCKSALKKISIKKVLLSLFVMIVLGYFIGKHIYNIKPESVKGRALVTKISLQKIAKQSLKGYGLFSFAGQYNNAKAHYFSETERPWNEVRNATYVFTAFNDYLLIAFELGIPVLLGLFLLIIFMIVKTKVTTETRLGLSLFTIIGIWALFNSPSEKILIMLPALFGFAIIASQIEFKCILNINDMTNVVVRFILTLISLLVIYAAYVKVINNDKYRDFGDIKNNQDIYELSYLYKFTDPSIYSDLYFGRKLYRYWHHDEAISYLEKTFKNSAAPRVGKQLASYYLNDGNYKRAKTIYGFNISVEPYRYEPRMDLLKLLTKSHKYDELVKLSQEIIDLPIKVPSEKIDKYKESASKKLKYYSRYVKSISGEGKLSPGNLIKSKVLNKTLPYKVYLPPINKIDKKLPVIYINDGYNYMRNGKLPKKLDSLIVNNIIKPVVAVFLDPRDKNKNWKNVRQELFLCNPSFVKFFTDEFIPKIEKQYPVSSKRKDRTILGLSFGGLAAAYLGDQAPNYFKNMAMQSPAFHPCPDIYKSYKTKPKKDFNIYLSYGTGKDTEKQDLPFIEILKHKKYDLKIERVEKGDHTWSVWEKQIDDILIHFFKNQ